MKHLLILIVIAGITSCGTSKWNNFNRQKHTKLSHLKYIPEGDNTVSSELNSDPNESVADEESTGDSLNPYKSNVNDEPIVDELVIYQSTAYLSDEKQDKQEASEIESKPNTSVEKRAENKRTEPLEKHNLYTTFIVIGLVLVILGAILVFDGIDALSLLIILGIGIIALATWQRRKDFEKFSWLKLSRSNGWSYTGVIFSIILAVVLWLVVDWVGFLSFSFVAMILAVISIALLIKIIVRNTKKIREKKKNSNQTD
ncbi:hypothetical protein K6119_04055 [Paracrocinitomix mangrovi]|uniref:hypothetical protein n=1 Tax=Paracrocinitomix mangrovi TaxID=2862509 RepID=UPI001C8EC644|nr:hypothetical protein [Paracrocinitomix mangrovi]UKN02686.1 hypothetical protein K6119_04055 [Paracrocinitomix mangrovi]